MDFAQPLPVTVICELLGRPVADEARLSAWSALLTRTVDPAGRAAAEFRADPDGIQRAGTELHAYSSSSPSRRVTGGPDPLSALIAAEDTGEPPSGLPPRHAAGPIRRG
ncbi:hypothetical protein AB0C34_26920 [Nocardia sp. NPDC049220]|uniref:hypothetical protein n=1 Tax=Nocardia sp. NPDC049220 TaxID=3155273 RepID=UPI0034049980